MVEETTPPALAPDDRLQRARLSRGQFPLARLVCRRLAAGVLTLVVVSLAIFLATNVLPGNVADAVLGKHATPTRVAAIEKELGLDRPLIARYWSWASGVVQGNLGQSAIELAQGAQKAPVTALVGAPLRNSLVLASITALLLLPISVAVGTAAAVREGRPT